MPNQKNGSKIQKLIKRVHSKNIFLDQYTLVQNWIMENAGKKCEIRGQNLRKSQKTEIKFQKFRITWHARL